MIKGLIVLIFISAMSATFTVKSTPFTLKPLHTKEQTYHLKNNNLATISMIFQPNCSWCKKQGKTLATAIKHCQGLLNISLIGTNGNRRQLTHELKHYSSDIPAFIADRQFLRKIGGYQASPTTLIFNRKDKLLVKKRGFIPAEQLANVLDMLTQGKCQL